jgi:hypothetical protein
MRESEDADGGPKCRCYMSEGGEAVSQNTKTYAVVSLFTSDEDRIKIAKKVDKRLRISSIRIILLQLSYFYTNNYVTFERI